VFAPQNHIPGGEDGANELRRQNEKFSFLDYPTANDRTPAAGGRVD
jgi:hypothetical protein